MENSKHGINSGACVGVDHLAVHNCQSEDHPKCQGYFYTFLLAVSKVPAIETNRETRRERTGILSGRAGTSKSLSLWGRMVWWVSCVCYPIASIPKAFKIESAYCSSTRTTQR